MKLISSYPRSGSARLKFILCYLLYPEFKGSFEQMSKFIPSIDNPMTRNDVEKFDFICTHANMSADIYLYRHVGDCLISEYYFKQKFFPIEMSLEEYIISTNYGEGWRKSVEQGMSAPVRIGFEDLCFAKKLNRANIILSDCLFEWELAIKSSTFKLMSEAENKKGFYYLPYGNEAIPYMRNGTSGQWKELSIADDICRANESELKMLNLTEWNDEKSAYVDMG